jgi:flagellar protein FlgJ
MDTPTITAQTSLALSQASIGKMADKAGSLKGNKDMEQIDAAARDFEAVFVTQMMKPMFEGLEPDPMFGGGKGEEIFQGMMLDEYGKLMAATGQFGIADSIKQDMIKMQERTYE